MHEAAGVRRAGRLHRRRRGDIVLGASRSASPAPATTGPPVWERPRAWKPLSPRTSRRRSPSWSNSPPTHPASASVGGAEYTASATASSGLAVTFSSATPAVCLPTGPRRKVRRCRHVHDRRRPARERRIPTGNADRTVLHGRQGHPDHRVHLDAPEPAGRGRSPLLPRGGVLVAATSLIQLGNAHGLRRRRADGRLPAGGHMHDRSRASPATPIIKPRQTHSRASPCRALNTPGKSGTEGSGNGGTGSESSGSGGSGNSGTASFTGLEPARFTAPAPASPPRRGSTIGPDRSASRSSLQVLGRSLGC